MNRELIISMIDNIINARNELDTAKEEYEDAEYNYSFEIIGVFNTLLEEEKTINFDNTNCFVRCCRVKSITKIKDDIKVCAAHFVTGEELTYKTNDLSNDELFHLAIMVINKTVRHISLINSFDDYDEDDTNDNANSVKVGKQQVINIDDTIINEDIFWSVVSSINWKKLSEFNSPVIMAKNIISGFNYSQAQIKELRDIFVRLQNELINEIKICYTNEEFTKNDSKLIEISDYIISLGEETYVDIFNGIEEIRQYVAPHPVHFLQCFS